MRVFDNERVGVKSLKVVCLPVPTGLKVLTIIVGVGLVLIARVDRVLRVRGEGRVFGVSSITATMSGYGVMHLCGHIKG